MAHDLYEASDPAKTTLDEAAQVLGQDLLTTMFNGPAEELKDTRNAQMALVAAEVAIARHLLSLDIHPAACAGHSVGEISALVISGSLQFQDALRLTRERASLMFLEAPPGTMAAVIGLDPEAIQRALPSDVDIANYNGPQQTIISGTIQGIKNAKKSLKQAGAKRVLPLPVSGPFHSQLMKRPGELLKAYLKNITIETPKHTFISSVTGHQETDPEIIRELLSQQIASPVRWTDVMIALGPIDAIEAGPGKVLQGIAKRIDGAPTVALAGTLEALAQL